jgi:cytochrome c551/c552
VFLDGWQRAGACAGKDGILVMAKDTNPAGARPDSPPDPIADRSLSGPVLIGAALLFLSLGWALYDEIFFQRPWKSYQREFVRTYTRFLNRLGPRQAAAEKAIFASPEFKSIDSQLKAAEQAATPKLNEIDRQLLAIRNELAAIKTPFQDVRARLAALTYELDHTDGAGGKKSLQQDIAALRKEPVEVSLPAAGGGGRAQDTSVPFADLERRFADLKARETKLVAEQTEISKPIRELRKKRNDYLSDNLGGLSQQQIDGLLRKMETFTVEIKQIHVAQAGLVERCESCHIGIREPLPLTAADMGGKDVFVSHPNKPLLAIHDPERFGCSPCHNGNGLATASVERAHGAYKHWLWPLFPKENSEAGCLQCHLGARVLEHAPVLTRGRDLFQLKGCAGCHRYEIFDREADSLAAARNEIISLEMRQKEARLEAGREIKLGDNADSNEAAQKHYSAAEILRVNASNMDAKISELDQQSKYLMQDVKKVGPNLKDVRRKLRKEWIPVWLKDPPAFRPGTKMPKFRLSDEEIRALSAFVWQSGLEGAKLAPQTRGDPARGKESLETRGCLACHSIGEGDRRIGGEFAANLSRVGEKASLDFITRWIHNPRDRLQPYCPLEKRDLGPEDYARHGLPYQFDLDHSACPNDGHELQVQNMTVMPMLRLSWDEARDIATYLTSLKHDNASYPSDVAFMDDSRLAERGRQLAGRYGCGSCHEIKGLEDAPRIGTELTKESSKPMEQLDFGLLEHKAKSEGWYNHKGFYSHKLENPAVYDQGREKAPEDRLRMPNIQLTKEDIRALNTFLLGSMDSPLYGEFRTIPAQFRYNATDQERDIQEGWWLVKKYNCMGCHTVQAGQKSVLSGIPRYQDPDWKEQLPPSLIQEGARVNPEWLAKFLANPGMNEKDTDRNGVRTYLKARMPTFNFSPNELGILVRFFEGLAGQSNPYFAQRLTALDERERQMARALFSSPGAPCLKCHLVGDPARDRYATAPNFLVAKERLKPAWTARWMLDPQAIAPGTAMPSGLFRKAEHGWVFAGETPGIFKGYDKDHVQLLVRYIFELSPEEQGRLRQLLPASALQNPRAAVSRPGAGNMN